MKKSNGKKKRKKWLPINLIVVGICGVFLPILPAIVLILIGLFLLFPNMFEIIRTQFLDQ